jgi:hypothetical protein
VRHSETIAKISAAILAVQVAVPKVTKTKEVGIDGARAQYKFKYPPHEEVWDAVRGKLAEHGIVVIQGGVEGHAGTQWLETMLVHGSGEWIAGVIRVENAQAGMQKLGAAWSYARRIGLLALLGVVPEGEDTDAAHEMQGREAKMPRVSKAARPAGVEQDDRGKTEEVLAQLDALTTLVQVDEASKELRGLVPKDLEQAVRDRFRAARQRINDAAKGASSS